MEDKEKKKDNKKDDEGIEEAIWKEFSKSERHKKER